MFGVRQQRSGAGDLACRFHARRRRRLILREIAGLIGQQEDVDGQLDEHRPGLARSRDPIGLEQCRHHFIMAGDAERRFGQPAHEFVGVHLMQLVAMAGIGARAAGEHQHRDAIEKGFADAACGMRQAGGRNHRQHADGIGEPADGIGHERRPALMRDQHLGDAVGIVERVVQFGRMHARNAEGKARADLLQRINREPGSRSLHLPQLPNVLPSIDAAAMRPERMQPPRKVPSSARKPCAPPPPKPAASPTA